MVRAHVIAVSTRVASLVCARADNKGGAARWLRRLSVSGPFAWLPLRDLAAPGFTCDRAFSVRRCGATVRGAACMQPRPSWL